MEPNSPSPWLDDEDVVVQGHIPEGQQCIDYKINSILMYCILMKNWVKICKYAVELNK